MTQTKLISGVHCTIYICKGRRGRSKAQRSSELWSHSHEHGLFAGDKKNGSQISIEQCNVNSFIGHAGYVCNILCIRSSKLIAFGRKLHLYTASFSILDRIPQEPIYLFISKQTAFVALAWGSNRGGVGGGAGDPYTYFSRPRDVSKQKVHQTEIKHFCS